MSASFGVHFGNTSACLSFCKDGKTEVVANDTGDRVTPAVVAFTDHDKSVGLAAKQGMIRNTANTVCNVKQLLGFKFDDPDVQHIINNSPVRIVQKNGQIAYEVEYMERHTPFSPREIATMIYQKMKQTASSMGNDNEFDAVLTVPLDFTETQKKAIRETALKAGFNPLRIISEPTAAVLAYDIGQTDINEVCNVLVFRLGGVSLDVTLINVNSGMYRILSSVSNKEVGGHHFTNLIVGHFATEFKRQWHTDCLTNKRAVIKLRNASENCKHILSKLGTSECAIDSLCEGIDLHSSISRARFESLSSGMMQNCLKSVEEALTKAGLDRTDVDKVVLCGGSSQIPSLQKCIRDYFSKAEVLSRLVPDEVIAIGAAKQASILLGNEEMETQRNEMENEVSCLSQDISVRVAADGSTVTVLPRHTPMPVRRSRKFTLADEQTSICLCIMQSSDEDQTQTIAKVVMRGLPAGSEVTAVFHLRSDGALHVTCTETVSGATQDVLIEAS